MPVEESVTVVTLFENMMMLRGVQTHVFIALCYCLLLREMFWNAILINFENSSNFNLYLLIFWCFGSLCGLLQNSFCLSLDDSMANNLL